MNKALKVAWIPKIEIIPEAALENVGIGVSKYYDAMFLPSNILSDFYSDILKNWQNTVCFSKE